MQHNYFHIILTQFSHNPAHRTHTHKHREHNTEYKNKHICSTQKITENKIQKQTYLTQHSTQNSAHNYRTYSIDLYHEFAYIKNSNTIELYTISKENI